MYTLCFYAKHTKRQERILLLSSIYKKFCDTMLNEKFDIQHKLLNILLSISLVLGLISTAVTMILCFNTIGNLFSLMLVFFVGVTLWISVKKNNVRLAVIIIVIAGDMLLLPAMFITNGGMASGIQLWYALGLIAPLVALKGRESVLPFIIGVISAVSCMVLEFCRPDLIFHPSNPTAESADLISSFIFFGIIIGCMFVYQAFAYEKQSRLLIERDKELMKAMKEAQSANNAKSSFLAHMSHEIRTPINAVLGMDEMIIRESTDKDITAYAMNIRSAGNSLLTIINDILDFSKIESDKMEIYPIAYNLSILLKDCYNLVYMRARDKNLKFSFEVDRNIPKSLVGDEFRIRQVVTNLLTNAVKYTPKGTVTMTVGYENIESNQIMLIFSVKDTGMGISEADKNKLFDSFRRVNIAQTHTIEGTGLGLVISKRLVDLMNGTITVESEYGKGSEFTVRIPQQIGGKVVIGEFSPGNYNVPEKQYKERFHAPDAKILIVDDVKINTEVIQQLIKKTLIISDCAYSGAECIELAAKEQYDIIFMDHLMPDMDGEETLDIIRSAKDGPNRNVPVIALTANAMAGAKEKYISMGFSDYLSKPVKGSELEDMLLRFLPTDKVIPYGENESRYNKNDIFGLEFLNTRAGISFCCGDLTFYKEVLREITESDLIDRLCKFYAARDWNNYSVCVHSIMGTSLSVGAEELAAKASAIANALKNDNLSYVKEHHRGFADSCNKLKDRLAEYFGEEA